MHYFPNLTLRAKVPFILLTPHTSCTLSDLSQSCYDESNYLFHNPKVSEYQVNHQKVEKQSADSSL